MRSTSMENSLEGADKKRSASFGKNDEKKERPPGERAAAGTPHYRWMGVYGSALAAIFRAKEGIVAHRSPSDFVKAESC